VPDPKDCPFKKLEGHFCFMGLSTAGPRAFLAGLVAHQDGGEAVRPETNARPPRPDGSGHEAKQVERTAGLPLIATQQCIS